MNDSLEAAAVCGSIANLMRDPDLSDAEYEGVRQAYGVALDAAGLGRKSVFRERLIADLADQLSYARGVKEVARLRIKCSMEEWDLVMQNAKRIYISRF